MKSTYFNLCSIFSVNQRQETGNLLLNLLKLGDNSVQMSPDVALTQFNVLGHRKEFIISLLSFYRQKAFIYEILQRHLPPNVKSCNRTRLVEASLSSGNYSRLLVDVVFERALGYYLIQV